MTVRDNKSATITAQNNFTDWMLCDAGDRLSVISQRTAFTGAVTMQRNIDGTVRDVTDLEGNLLRWVNVDINGQWVVDEAGEYRVGVKTGDFNGTNVYCRLGKG